MLAQQFDRAFIRGSQTFQYLDGGCFSSAIRAKQTETLAREHFEIEPVDGGYVSKSLNESRASQSDW